MEKFRRLTVDDAQAYFDVIRNSYKQNEEDYNVFMTAGKASFSALNNWILEHPTYGLFEDDELVSSITLRMPWGNSPGPKPCPHIAHFVTNLDYKGNGYAKKLLEIVEKKVLLEELKCTYVTLGTAVNHPWLKDMYLGMGFEIFDVVQVEGRPHHTIFFCKDLVNMLAKEHKEKKAKKEALKDNKKVAKKDKKKTVKKDSKKSSKELVKAKDTKKKDNKKKSKKK